MPEEADEKVFCWELEVGGISVWLPMAVIDWLMGCKVERLTCDTIVPDTSRPGNARP